MSKDDYVIILGDFGIWRDSPQQRWYLNWLEEKHFTTLFIDGNHENYDILDSYPVEEWHGGKVHFIKLSIIHLMRGQVFDIDGLKFCKTKKPVSKLRPTFPFFLFVRLLL